MLPASHRTAKEHPMSTTAAAVRPTAVTWFELSAADYEGAVRFYERIFATQLRREMFGTEMAIFPYADPGVGGCIVQRDGVAGNNATVVYLNADGRLDAILARVPDAGGRIVEQKMYLENIGWVAVIADPEGNHVGLHAMS
jgi:predicted enzyme related to lactoylglutathione lyase